MKSYAETISTHAIRNILPKWFNKETYDEITRILVMDDGGAGLLHAVKYLRELSNEKGDLAEPLYLKECKIICDFIRDHQGTLTAEIMSDIRLQGIKALEAKNVVLVGLLNQAKTLLTQHQSTIIDYRNDSANMAANTQGQKSELWRESARQCTIQLEDNVRLTARIAEAIA